MFSFYTQKQPPNVFYKKAFLNIYSLFLTKLQASYSPWNHQEIYGFLVFPGGIEGLQLCQKKTTTQVFSCE